MNPNVHAIVIARDTNPMIKSIGSRYAIIKNIKIRMTAAGTTIINESVITPPNSPEMIPLPKTVISPLVDPTMNVASRCSDVNGDPLCVPASSLVPAT